jgi:L-ascorbate metabolism protein UlaG (beta-lactamase superfamily)
MTITWLGRACFKIVHDGYTIVIDPYTAASTGYPELHVNADMVLVSHNHRGHDNVSAVKLSGTTRPCPFTIDKVVVGHDEANGNIRGMNTMHILEADGIKLVHAGDVGFYCNDGRLFAPDVLMIGTGSFRTLPSYVLKDMADEMGANVIIPMHYHHGNYGNRRMCTLEEFTDLYEGEVDVIKYPTDTIEITKGMPRQVAVLKYMG